MISCLDTSMVTTRKSIFTMRSTMGNRKMRPGPFALSNLPSRKITPRSYSRRMRNVCGSRMATMMTITTRLEPIFMRELIMSGIVPPLLSFGVNFQRQTFDSDDLDGLILFDRNRTDGIPVFAFDENPAAVHVDSPERGHDFAHHGLAPGPHGQPLRAQAGAHHEQKEQRGHRRRGNDPEHGKLKPRPGMGEQHQRAEEKGD